MSNRTNAYFTFNPTSMITPPTNGFVAGNFIHANEVNGISYASFNFVNSFINSLVSKSQLQDKASYTYNGTNLSTLISGDMDSWIDYRIESVEHSTFKLTNKTNNDYTTKLDGQYINATYKVVESSTKINYNYGIVCPNYLAVDYDYDTYDPTGRLMASTNHSFHINNNEGNPSLSFEKSLISTNPLISYDIAFPTDILSLNSGESTISLNSTQAYVCKYTEKPATSDIKKFIEKHPTIKVLGFATYAKVKEDDEIKYLHSTWQYYQNESASENAYFYRFIITRETTASGSNNVFIMVANQHMANIDWERYSYGGTIQEYYEVVYFC